MKLKLGLKERRSIPYKQYLNTFSIKHINATIILTTNNTLIQGKSFEAEMEHYFFYSIIPNWSTNKKNVCS
jgi:hypothetical protein